MKSIGVILIVLGLLGFAVTGISFTTSEEVVDVGPLEVQREEERSIPVSPFVAGGAVLVGIGLVVAGRRRDS
jgi:hypothetical protein